MKYKIPLTVAAIVVTAITAAGWYWYEYGGRAARMARSPDPARRLLAIHDLAGRRGALAAETLEGLAADKDLRVAVHAVRALGENHADRRRLAVLRILRDAARPAVRAEAAAALGGFRNPGDRDALLPVLRGDAHPAARAGAARGLGRLGDRAALPGLVDALADGDAELRHVAIRAIQHVLAMRPLFEPDAPEPLRRRQVRAIRKWMKDKGLY